MTVSLVAIPVRCLLVILGFRLIRDGRRSQSSAVATVLFQWPNNIVRAQNPVGFWSSVLVATFCGYLSVLFGVITVIGNLVVALAPRVH